MKLYVALVTLTSSCYEQHESEIKILGIFEDRAEAKKIIKKFNTDWDSFVIDNECFLWHLYNSHIIKCDDINIPLINSIKGIIK